MEILSLSSIYNYHDFFYLSILKYGIIIMKKSILFESESNVHASMESLKNGKQRDFKVNCDTIFEIFCRYFYN